jgi:surface antigen
MALLDSFYGETPAYLGGLLGADELKRLQEQAQSQSNLGMAAALLQAGAPSRTPTGGALAIAQGLQQGQQLYKQALNQGLQEKMTAMQLNEQLRKAKEAEAIRQFLPTLIQPGAVEQNWSGAPEQIGQYFKTGQVPTTQAPSTINRQALQQLALLSPETYARYKPEYKEVDGKLVEISPLTGISTVAGTGKLSYQDLGNVVVALDSSGKEVGRFAKGVAPQGPVSLQSVETENGVMTFNPRTGQYTPVTAGGQPLMGKGAGKLTEAEGNAVTYGMRMQQADSILKPLENAGLKDTGKIRAGVSGTLGATPLIGEALARGSDNVFNTLPTIMGGLNEDQQKTVQARVNFITAILRKESGASISPTEFATAEKNYFPAPGDSETIVKQKQAARELAIKGMKIQAGKGAKFIDQGQGTWEVVR